METDENFTFNSKTDLIAFVPFRLLIPDRPELAHFARNILIGRYTIRDNRAAFGSVLYEPDLESFSRNESGTSMNYLNPLDKTSRMEFTVCGDICTLIKYFREKKISMSYGIVKGLDDINGWRNFFLHVGELGLAVGEVVIYEMLKNCEIVKNF